MGTAENLLMDKTNVAEADGVSSSAVSGLLKLLKSMLSSARPTKRVCTVLSKCLGMATPSWISKLLHEFDFLQEN